MISERRECTVQLVMGSQWSPMGNGKVNVKQFDPLIQVDLQMMSVVFMQCNCLYGQSRKITWNTSLTFQPKYPKLISGGKHGLQCTCIVILVSFQ